MYSSYYSPNGILKSKSSKSNNIRKSTSQYLFLNALRAFSIIYLILTIFYIPVYLGMSEVNSLYWQQQQTNYTHSQRIFLQGTIFAIKKYENCYQKQQETIKVYEGILQQEFYQKSDGKYCFVNKVSFIPFVNTVEDFHTFYFSYFLVMYLAAFSAVAIADHMNKKLYIELEYPSERRNWRQKLQSKKIFHVSCEVNDHLYFTKPVLNNVLQKIFEYKGSKITVRNISICLNENFRRYGELHIESKLMQENISSMRKKLIQKNEKQEQMNEISEEILQMKERLEKVEFQMSHLLIEIQKVLDNKENYHYGHFFVHVDSFKDILMVNQLTLSSDKHLNNNKSLSITIDIIEPLDLLKQNIQNREIIKFLSSIDKSWNEQFWTGFRPNKHYRNLNRVLQFVKVFSGCVLCIILMILIDVVILIIKRTEIFSYPTILVVLVLEIILKLLINHLSQLEHHSKFSQLKLSIMLKLTILIFVNLVVVLFVGLYDLGPWKMGEMLSTYELSEVDEKWYLKIGTSIIFTVLTKIMFCNLRVYIEIIKSILLKFLEKHLFSLLKLNKLKQRFLIWVDDIRQNYHKPIIDLQVCYAQILPIYMIGIVFGYFFPVLYPLLCIFSISIHYTHQKYIEYETSNFLYNGMNLNDWAFALIYLGFIGGLGVVVYIEWENKVFVFLTLGLQSIIFIVKLVFSNLNQMTIQKLQQLSQQQQRNEIIIKNIITQGQSENEQNIQSQRKFVKEHQQPEIKQIKNDFIRRQLKQKEIELTLLRLFGSQGQNINDVHASYYQKYEQIIRGEMNFLESLEKEFQQKL